MTYAQGGVIQAADYNNLISGTNQLNTVWAVGNGSSGYGQPTIPTVATSGLVTATQWASLINATNSASTHQSGSGTGIGAPTTGSVVSYINTLSGAINTLYTNRLNAASRGTTTTGTVYTASASAANNTVYGEASIFYRYVTFSSGDAARYFFNSGGQINFVITGVSNNDGTARSADAVTTIATNLGGVTGFGSVSNGGITGSGGTVNTNNTSFGYWNLTTGWQNTHTVTSTSATYTSDFAKVYFLNNSGATNLAGNGDNGAQIAIALNYQSNHSNYGSGFNDTLNITVSHRVDIVYPETTNLTTASWGTVTIS